jgi:hypothetical protein
VVDLRAEGHRDEDRRGTPCSEDVRLYEESHHHGVPLHSGVSEGLQAPQRRAAGDSRGPRSDVAGANRTTAQLGKDREHTADDQEVECDDFQQGNPRLRRSLS